MKPPTEKQNVLIVVRTYPTPAQKGVEVSCTAGITETGEWRRLFPIPYRFLEKDQRFGKYQWIEVTVSKASNDSRPESFKVMPGPGSIKVLSERLPTTHQWQARKDRIFPLKSHCLCCLKKERDSKGFPTLGIFRPRIIEKLLIEPAESPTWSQAQLEILRQGNLFEKGPDKELEKIPYDFRYRFRCDEDSCKGHKMICTDWEMGESWRKWKDEYGAAWESKFRERYQKEMIEEKDTHFYVGTMHQHPKDWIIVGLFYPPRPEPTPLFN